MNNLKYLLSISGVLFLALSTNSISAQNFPFIGARSMGVAHASTTLADEYSVFNNPGALGFISTKILSLGYQAMYSVEGLHSKVAAGSLPLHFGVASLGIFTLGDDLYRQNKISFGFGNRFGLAGMGMAVNYHHYIMEGFGTRGFLTLDIGGLAEISTKVLVSGLVKNITQSKISKFTGEYMPTIMIASLSFRPSDRLLLNTQYDKSLEYPGVLKIGMEYQYSSLILRTGLITDPILMSFGAGFHYKKMKFDYGILIHQILGSNQGFTFAMKF